MFDRYAVYFTASGDFAQLGAAWLGWDIGEGCHVSHPQLPEIDLPQLVQRPRKYGFHATIKPPFALAIGQTESLLTSAVKEICTVLSPVTLQGLEVAALGRFLALIPLGDTSALNVLAGRIVTELDLFRAPMPEQELERRSKGNLTAEQRKNLDKWGYPHVMDQYRFHMTLTGRMPQSDLAEVQSSAAQYFSAHTNRPLPINSLTLVGQKSDGYFVEIERFPLVPFIQ